MIMIGQGGGRVRWRRMLAGGGALAVGAAAMALPAAGPAHASDGNSWIRFPGMATEASYARSPTAADRSFVREWENNPPRGFPTLSPANVEAMKAAIKRYEAIVARGGWPLVPDIQMAVGMTHEAVAALRERLLASGDLREETSGGGYFDYGLEKGVKRFQASNGLTPTGVVDKRTVAALNVPAQVRLKQLKTNLGRLQELARSTGRKYVVVNIPAAQIEAVEGDRVVSRHSGVVGKLDRPSPLLRSAIHELNFNPVWHLPPTVIEKDLIPKGIEMQRKGQDVLAKYKIDAYDGNGRKLDGAKVNWANGARNLVYRQQPGPENPLGFLKINFHNSYSVYMHSTPSETLFGRNFRAASSGCVRVQGIEQLAEWVLADNGGWTAERIAQMKASGERADVKVKKPVPLYFVYITAWATEDGIVQFRRDLYNKDGVGNLASSY
jgi:murein L,D-transpeptidase YcbB/YkuD